MARDLIFFGYTGAAGRGDGSRDFDKSLLATARTLKLHLERRFPRDRVEIVCAWNKDVFVRKLQSPGPKIRQIHYVGHGAGGGLFFGYGNPIAKRRRSRFAGILRRVPVSRLPDAVKRRFALRHEPGLISGFFTVGLEPAKLATIKSRLAGDAHMHIWGCFAGARAHRFDPDPWWNRFNPGGAPAEGIARHIARSLGIDVTAVRDPRNTHGMSFCVRDQRGVFNCSNKRRPMVPTWLWPRGSSVRWVTWDRAGNAHETQIRFFGQRIPAARLKPGRPPAWFAREIPVATAKAREPAFPATCAPAAVGF